MLMLLAKLPEVNISPKTNISAQTLKNALPKNPEMQYLGIAIFSGCVTKFCHRDFVLKYVVIGEKRTQVESGLFRDLFWSRSEL